MIKFNPENLYFLEQRFQMSMAERFIIRFITYCGYAIFIAAVATFLFSDIGLLFWSGVLGLLFLIDRLFHFGRPGCSLTQINPREFSGARKINIVQYLAPSGFSVLEKARDKALITNGNFFVYLAKFLLENRDVQDMLVRLDVKPKEFEQKINEFLQSRNNAEPRIAEQSSLRGRQNAELRGKNSCESTNEIEVDQFFKNLIGNLKKDPIKNSQKLKETLRRLTLIKEFNTNKRLQMKTLNWV